MKTPDEIRNLSANDFQAFALELLVDLAKFFRSDLDALIDGYYSDSIYDDIGSAAAGLDLLNDIAYEGTPDDLIAFLYPADDRGPHITVIGLIETSPMLKPYADAFWNRKD